MIVSDLLAEAAEITGLCPGILLYKAITRAIEDLSKMNKGQWDALQCYLDIAVQDNGIVILPREVFAPIKININRNPAFTRGRLYEFSLMGPGNDADFVGWSWMDQNTVPLLADLPSIGAQLVVAPANPLSANDNGKIIRFYGLDATGNEISEEVIIDNATPPTTVNSYRTMRRVRKDLTVNRITVSLANGGDLVANYYGDEVEPKYRKIKVPKRARTIHMLFRKNTLEVTGPDDFIPLDSGSAILTMLKANRLSYSSMSSASDEVAALEKRALQRLQEDQDTRNAFAAAAGQDQIAPALDYNINNRDSLIAADIIDDAMEIFGPIGLQNVLDRVTDSIELLNNMSSTWEAAEGYIDINVGTGGIVTLPRYIYRPIKINLGRHPLRMRNRWFEFHLDGPGTINERHSYNYWDDLGKSVTIYDPVRPFRLVAINDLDADDGSEVRVYGYDESGRYVRTPNPDVDSDEKYIDGVILTASYSNTLPDELGPKFSRIERVTRDGTNGYQQLLAYLDDDAEPILVGYYYPDETEPNYSRIRLPYHNGCSWIRMRYRKRELKITHLTEPLHIKSRMAVINMMRAVKAQSDDPTKATAFKAEAFEQLTNQEIADNPSQQHEMEFAGDVFADPQQGQF